MIIDNIIDLDLTINSGQTSQPPWREVGGVFSDVVVVGGEPCIFNVANTDEGIDFNYTSTFSKDNVLSGFNFIFDLDFDLNRFYKFLNNHDELKEMSEFCYGLRLFKAKDPFECVVSSICSANNSIARWTKSVSVMKEKWGGFFDGFHIFPSPQRINNVFIDCEDEINVNGVCCDDNLKACGVGYRAQYIKKASELFLNEFDVYDFFNMKYDEAFETILKVPGVGPKVADCILLYGFDFKEAFPSDVWIKRIVSHLYFDGKDVSVDKVRSFGMDEFGKYAGYVQLYMFHYARKSGLMLKLK